MCFDERLLLARILFDVRAQQLSTADGPRQQAGARGQQAESNVWFSCGGNKFARFNCDKDRLLSPHKNERHLIEGTSREVASQRKLRNGAALAFGEPNAAFGAWQL
jgi:hypothetical protein